MDRFRGGRKRSASSISRKSDNSDVFLRDGKNSVVRSRLYEQTFKAVGIHMGGGSGLTEEYKQLCKTLLETERPFPSDTLFRDDRFDKTCQRLRNKNEVKVTRILSPLLVPSVEVLCAHGAKELEYMMDHCNQKWEACVPVVPGSQ